MTTEIVVSEASIKIIDAQKLTPKSIVVVTVDVGNLPVSKATEYMQAIKEIAVPVFAPAKVVLTPKGVDIQVFEPEE